MNGKYIPRGGEIDPYDPTVNSGVIVVDPVLGFELFVVGSRAGRDLIKDVCVGPRAGGFNLADDQRRRRDEEENPR